MGLPTLKVSWISYERFSSYRSNKFVAKKGIIIIIITRAKIFLQAKMESYNVTLHPINPIG